MRLRTQAVDGPRIRLTARAALLIVVVTILAMLWTVPLREYLAQRSEIADLEARAATIEQTNAAVRGDIAQLHDPLYLERLARSCLGMVKPGEVAFVTKGSASDPDC